MIFSLVSQVLLLLWYPVIIPGHFSQHAKAATGAADNLTFSDPKET
jgi:hypothetical protein